MLKIDEPFRTNFFFYFQGGQNFFEKIRTFLEEIRTRHST